MKLSGWGRYPVIDCAVATPRGPERVAGAVAGALATGPLIARGNGRAYGDAAMSRDCTLRMGRADRMISFDAGTGVLVAEAGVILADVIAAFLPRGWFPAVTPGTKFVTLGGMAAADVHGKNHHRDGSFGAFVDWLDLLGPDGAVRRCARDENAELFGWTIGGMGLTGVILRLAIRLRPVETAWIRQVTLPAPDLEAAMAAFETADVATYSVAWIDCLAKGAALGRSLVMLGEHAGAADLPRDRRSRPFRLKPKRRLSVPPGAPGFALNRYSVRAFNALYWRRGRKSAGARLVDWESYFYPLDGIAHWNRIYGRKGFVQFQCVLPPGRAAAGLRALLETTAAAGQGSFLAVLKRMGAQQSAFSFPMEGYTLALDFPASRTCLALCERLDAIALEHGGRFYLAKDARMARTTQERSDPRTEAFRAFRDREGLSPAFRSVQSERLAL